MLIRYQKQRKMHKSSPSKPIDRDSGHTCDIVTILKLNDTGCGDSVRYGVRIVNSLPPLRNTILIPLINC